MENQNQNASNSYMRSDAVVSVPSASAAQGQPSGPQALSLDPVVGAATPIAAAEVATKKPNLLLRIVSRADVILAILLLLGAVGLFWSVSQSNNEEGPVSDGAASRFGAVDIPLQDISVAEGNLNLGSQLVTINGLLEANGGLVVAPSSQPAAGVPGQIYYDQTSNVLAYYDGNEFVTVASADGVVQSLGGLNGEVTLGPGLSAAGGTLSNAGVLSLQGQTGEVALTPGSGIAITGTTITNAGVIGVASGSPNIVVNTDANGTVTISSSAGGGTVSSPGGTAGTIPVFTGAQTIANSLLSQSGGTITVGGNLTVSGDLTVSGTVNLSTPLGVSSGGTGTTSLTANGVLVGQGTNPVTAVNGSEGQCLLIVSGAPDFTTCPGGGGSGVSTVGAIDSEPKSANGAVIIGTIIHFQTADATFPGMVSTGVQTFAGDKTFNDTLAVGVLGSANSDAVICRNTATNQLSTCSSTFATTSDLDDYVQLQPTALVAPQTGNINVSGSVVAGSFTGSGANLADLNASNIATGTLADARLSTNVALLNAPANFTAALQQNGNDVCTTAGNCAGVGNAVDSLNTLQGDLTLAGTAGQIVVNDNGVDTITLSLGNTVTLQGNTFNGAGQLVQLNASSQLPAVSGALLTDLNASALTTGTVANARLVNGGALTVTAGNGLSGGGSVALGGNTTLDVEYGSTANTAVQGNTQLTVTAGTNLTGGGAVTLGALGNNVTVNVADSPTFAGNVTVQGGNVTVGTAGPGGIDGSLTLQNATNAFSVSFNAPNQTVGSATVSLPDTAGADDTVCLQTLGNCVGTGGSIQGSGTTNRLAVFTSGNSIGDSSITDDGSAVTLNGDVDLAVQGSSVTVGTPSSRTGSMVLHNGTNANTVAIQSGVTGASYTLTLPTAAGSTFQCLKAQDGAGTLFWDDCEGGQGGTSGVTSLNGMTGAITINNASGAGGAITIDDAAADGTTKGIATFNATNFSDNGTGLINTIQDIALTSTPTFGGLTLNGTLNMGANDIAGTNFSVQGSSGNVTSGLINGQTISNNANFTGQVTIAGTLNVNTITPSGPMTIGATSQSLTLQGNASTTLTATGGGFTTTIGFTGVPTGNVTYSLDRAASTGTYEICTTAENCVGLGDGVTGTGTANTVPIFTGPQTIGDSIITQNADIVNVGGSLTLDNALTVANGGTGATSFTANGVLYGNGISALQATAAPTSGQVLLGNGAGVPTFTTLSGDVTVNGSGVTAISPDAVALGTDTTGNYVATITNGNGISGSSASEGGTPTIALGDLTANWLQSGAFDIVLNNANSELSIMDGSGSFLGTLDVGALTAAQTYTLPDATGTICLDTGNCAGQGGMVQGSGTSNTLAKFTSDGSTIGDSTITDDGATVTIGAVLNVSGNADIAGTLTAGTANAFQVSTSGAVTAVGVNAGAGLLQGTGGLTITGATNINATGTADTAIGNTAGTLALQGNASTSLTATSGADSTGLVFAAPSGTHTITLPAETGTVCLQNSASCGFVQGTAANFIQNQNASQQATSNFWISGTGRADGGLQAPSLDTATAAALQVGATNATSVTIGNAANNTPITLQSGTGTITIGAGDQARTINIGNVSAAQAINIGASATTSTTNLFGGSGGINLRTEASNVLVRGLTNDSTDAFLVQNTAGNNIFQVDTSTPATRIMGTGTFGSGGRLYFGSVGDNSVAFGESSTGDSDTAMINGLAGLNIFTGGADGSSNLVASWSGTGELTLQNSSNSSTAFQVQDVAGAGLLTVDTTARSASGGNLIKIGNSTGTDGALTLLQLDATTADPTTNLSALNGSLFYNSSTHKVSLIEDGQVKIICNTTDLGCGTGTVMLQDAYDNGNTITTSDGRDVAITLADTTTDSNFLVDIATGSTGRFAIQGNSTDILGVTPGAVALGSNVNLTMQGTFTNSNVINIGGVSGLPYNAISNPGGAGTAVTGDNDLYVQSDIEYDGNLYTSLTGGSVPFIGGAGVLTEDNTGLFFDSSNNRLGVGTDSPQSAIHVDGDADDVVIEVEAHGTDNSPFIQFHTGNDDRWLAGLDDSDNGDFKISFDNTPGGGRGVFGVNDFFILEKTGALFLTSIGTVPGTSENVLCINGTTGQVRASASTTECTNSSARFKDNIENLSNEMGLELINALRPVTFTYKDGDGSTEVGLIAEEVAEVLPEVVAYDEEGLPTAIDYSHIVTNLIKAIQQQQVQIDELREGVLSGALVEISGHIRVGHDTVGTITIPAGQTSANVTFNTPYEFVPKITTGASDFVTVIVTDKTVNGFTVRIPGAHDSDVHIDWTALEASAE